MYVYVIKTCDNAQLIKIGKANSPEKRLIDLQVANPTRLKLVNKIPCLSEKHALEMEKRLHQTFKQLKVRGEWFRYSRQIREFLNAAEKGDEKAALKALEDFNKRMKREAKYRAIRAGLPPPRN